MSNKKCLLLILLFVSLIQSSEIHALVQADKWSNQIALQIKPAHGDRVLKSFKASQDGFSINGMALAPHLAPLILKTIQPFLSQKSQSLKDCESGSITSFVKFSDSANSKKIDLCLDSNPAEQLIESFNTLEALVLIRPLPAMTQLSR